MIKNAIISFENNQVIWIGENETIVLTPPPDYVIDITNCECEVLEGMIYDQETNTFYWAENENLSN